MADYSHHSSVTNMLTNLKLPSLEHRRTTSSLILFYKIIHNLIYIPSSDLIPITSCTIEVNIKDFNISMPEHHYTATQEKSEFGTLYMTLFGSSPYLNSSLSSNHPIITDQLYYLLIIINN